MPIARAQHVVVRFPGGRPALHAQVEADEGETVTLVLAVKPSSSFPGWGEGTAVVEYTTRRGIHRLTGSILSDRATPEIIRLRRDGQPEVLQRRNFVRVDAVVPLGMKITDPVRGAAHTTTLNVSGGGMLFRDPIGLPFGAEIDLEMELAPGSPPVRAKGRVVREAGPDVKGVEILSIGREDRERLVRYVTERERMAMRIARGG